MKAFNGVAAAVVLGAAVMMTGTAAMADEAIALQFTPEEKTLLQLGVDFNRCMMGKQATFKSAMAAYEAKINKIYEEEKEKLMGLPDADLDAAAVRAMLEARPPLKKENAEKMTAGASRSDKVEYVAQREALARAQTMSDADLDAAVSREAAKEGATEDQIRQGLSEMSRDDKVGYVAEKTVDTAHAAGMGDDELNETAVRELMAENPGISQMDAENKVAMGTKGQKADFVARRIALAERKKLGEPLSPADSCHNEMKVDKAEFLSRVYDLDKKYGRGTFRDEVLKVLRPSSPAP